MIDRDLLLKDTKKLVSDLVDDLRRRTDDVEEIRTAVRGQYQAARDARRTDRSYEEWREDLLAQVAVGWVLATVFIRFCEDNGLYATPLLSGPGPRRDLAGDHRADWLAEHPTAGDREWLQEVFTRYRRIPATGQLFGEHNPLWQFGPSDDGARAIVELWRRVDPQTGALHHDFIDTELSTRFLGDLYQDLSEHAKKTYALLQTPDFVEEFILDRTLDPAIETFGLEEVRMIDPTCGSGHFLLGAFERIFKRWREREPGTPLRELVQRTLDAVNGVDLNPFAVEIARFRLLVASLKASGIGDLRDAPAFEMNVAVGDSLIHGRQGGQLFSGAEEFGPLLRHRYPTEDEEAANRILEPGRYHAVVGNPPYITVRDPGLNAAYRAIYTTCFRKYSLVAPFTERFFDLAQPSQTGMEAGFVGMIVSNSFMKREMGRPLVEDFLPKVDVTHVIDTSMAHIPGHNEEATPTLILFARNGPPQANTIRSVLGIRPDPNDTIGDPRKAPVWSSITTLVDRPGSENEFVSVEDTARDRYAKHPWSLQGGAAPQTLHLIVQNRPVLDPHVLSAGFVGISAQDEVMLLPREFPRRHKLEDRAVSPVVEGAVVRDWMLKPRSIAFFPYDGTGLVDLGEMPAWARFLWPYRTTLGNRATFNKKTYFAEGRPWWEWHQVALDRMRDPLTIAFSFVATHNHFTLDRGGKVFNRSAPIIKLVEGDSIDLHHGLIGLLNSSVAMFWARQVYYDKGTGQEAWERRIEWDNTKLLQFPITDNKPAHRARELDRLVQQLAGSLPSAVVEDATPTRDRLAQAHERVEAIRSRMVAIQEELDWECYHLYGLTDEELTAPADQVPALKKGERAFEIVLARKMAAGEAESSWFSRHGSTPITELPAHWPEAYRRVVERRIALIESDRSIGLLERPEYKRRWNWASWEDLQKEALRGWLLDRLEARELWAEGELMTTARLADRVRRSEEFLEAARLYTGRVDVDLTELVTELVKDEAVPFAAGYRFKASGLRRRREWEEVWELQRQEDAIDARTALPADDPQHLTEAAAERLKKEQGLDRIPVPPKYRKSDYADATTYRLRGKLDVPQERFILYPGTRKGADTTPAIGWAGWDHLEQARALAGHYSARKYQGAEEAELVSLLAGLQELVPWLLQWHNEMDQEFGYRMGDFFASFVETEAQSLGRTVEDLKTWTPK